MDRYSMFVENYVTFVMQQPPVATVAPPPITVTFNSWEIWEVQQSDGTNLEMWTSETGNSSTVIKKNGLSFLFNVDANYTPETRQKVFHLFYYAAKGCDISFTFNRYQSFIPTFPHNTPTYTPGDLNNPAVTLPYCCLGANSNFIDSTHEGLGVLIGENSNITFLVKESVDPLDLMPCKRLSILDLALEPWITDFDGTGYYISTVFVEVNPLGLIAQFMNHPDGTLQMISPTLGTPSPCIFFQSVNGTNTQMLYADDLISTYVNNGDVYEIVIPDIKVLLKTGETCYITFIQQFTIVI